MFPEGIFSGKLYSPTPLASCMALFAIEVCLYSHVLLIDSLQHKLKDTDINVESAMICKYNMMIYGWLLFITHDQSCVFLGGQRRHFASLKIISCLELGFIDEFVLSQNKQLKSCPLYSFENIGKIPVRHICSQMHFGKLHIDIDMCI